MCNTLLLWWGLWCTADKCSRPQMWLCLWICSTSPARALHALNNNYMDENKMGVDNNLAFSVLSC